jgi:hypothetical protein
MYRWTFFRTGVLRQEWWEVPRGSNGNLPNKVPLSCVPEWTAAPGKVQDPAQTILLGRLRPQRKPLWPKCTRGPKECASKPPKIWQAGIAISLDAAGYSGPSDAVAERPPCKLQGDLPAFPVQAPSPQGKTLTANTPPAINNNVVPMSRLCKGTILLMHRSLQSL